jgi:paraquat-inducible protein B
MNMATEKGYFRLGLFVIAGFAVLIGGVIMLGSNAGKKDVIPLETYLLESAQGLFVGSDVKVHGVTVGKVTGIDLAVTIYTKGDIQESYDKGSYVVVRFEINDDLVNSQDISERAKRIGQAVDRGLRARMATAGLTGPTYLELVFLDPARNPVPTISWTPRQIYVPYAPSTINAITKGLEEIIISLRRARITDLINNADDMILALKAQIEKIDTQGISDNAVALLKEARDTNDKVKAILADPKIVQTISNIEAMSGSLKELTGSQEVADFAKSLPQIADRLKSSSERLDVLLHDKRLDQALTDLAGTLRGSDLAVTQARRSLKEISVLLTSQQEDLAGIVSALKRTTDNLSKITQDAVDNPARLIFGKPPVKKQPGQE